MEEVPTTARRGTLRILLALISVTGALLAAPVAADTKGELDAAKARLTQIQAQLNQATAAWQQAEAQYAQTLDDIGATRASIARLQRRIQDLRERLATRAREAFESGPGGTIELLLSSASFADFSDRLEFLGSMAESDASLVVDERVSTEELRREQQDLTRLSERQAQAAAAREAAKQQIASNVAAAQRQVNELTTKLRAELAAARQLALLGQTPIPGASLQVCPVAGPNAFVDSFGAPRPGGRTHQGIDMMAALGTPVVAAQPGNAVRTPNSLGGNAVVVYGPGGDWTYYAHLSAYAATGSVSAGTVIGSVGNSGDAAGGPYHLHFEYHPHGGSAIDPYAYLLAVC